MTDPEKFHFTLPETDGPSGWDGLSQAARDTLSGQGFEPGPASHLAPNQDVESVVLDPAIRSWAEGEGGLLDAIIKWQKYDAAGKIVTPSSLEALLKLNPNTAATLSRFFDASEALYRTGATNPDGINIGETMHLVLIPWTVLSNSLHAGTLKDKLTELRSVQGKVKAGDYFARPLENAWLADGPLYRDDSDPATRWEASTYLKRKIIQDGPWGMMLAQTSNEGGVSSLRNESPDTLTKRGTEHFSLAGYNVDAMGVFEWLSLTLQEDPAYFSDDNASSLLANRIRIPGPDRTSDRHLIPAGRWDGDEERLDLVLEAAEESDNSVLPRLAVL